MGDMRLHVGVVGVAALGAGWLFKVSIPNFVWQVNSACSACLTIDTSCVQIALPSNKALNAIRGMAALPSPTSSLPPLPALRSLCAATLAIKQWQSGKIKAPDTTKKGKQ